MADRLPKPAAFRSILLIATRQIGDVLLATPLLRSLRRAWPAATIDFLVYTGKGAVLEGNPDCNAVIESDEHPDRQGYFALLRRIFRRYDLAVTTQANDRGHLYAFLAARHRVGLIPDASASSAWKRASCDAWTVLDDVHTHTVVQNLRLADLLGIPLHYEVVLPRCLDAAQHVAAALPWPADRAYAVLHPIPMWQYKRWSAEGWGALVAWLRARGLYVALTGGPGAEEVAFCDRLASLDGVINLAGKLPFRALPALIGAARLFVGPDTSVTHLAAASGVPTLALYGPTNPVKWGPWPVHRDNGGNPYARLARPWQRSGNVLLLQGIQPADREACLPCHKEGCDRHRASSSRCLLETNAGVVIAAAAELLG